MTNGGSVDLYYNNSKKLETTDSGVTVTGEVSADPAKFTRSTTSGSLFTPTDCSHNHVIRIATNNSRLLFYCGKKLHSTNM